MCTSTCIIPVFILFQQDNVGYNETPKIGNSSIKNQQNSCGLHRCNVICIESPRPVISFKGLHGYSNHPEKARLQPKNSTPKPIHETVTFSCTFIYIWQVVRWVGLLIDPPQVLFTK